MGGALGLLFWVCTKWVPDVTGGYMLGVTGGAFVGLVCCCEGGPRLSGKFFRTCHAEDYGHGDAHHAQAHVFMQ
ncbi:hypothetical protein SAMN04487857_12722 [Pseudomonas sp. ok272]|nr:hypothetical protein SAMN04487857_12722 [Pseudomonas sp. ok272]SFN41121.1 hypothetical protein SAMN04487858_12622 [Pseudomonas sp. ok602]